MQRCRQLIFSVLAALLLVSCERTSYQSSVPAYPVHAVIDTRTGQFVHFQPTIFSSYVLVNRDGYFLDGQFVIPLGATDACGYGGIIVFVSLSGYDAYDMACPHCASISKRVPCDMDGIYAVCPECGEQYDLGSGTAVPTKGIAHETLRRLNIINSDGKLTITQR